MLKYTDRGLSGRNRTVTKTQSLPNANKIRKGVAIDNRALSPNRYEKLQESQTTPKLKRRENSKLQRKSSKPIASFTERLEYYNTNFVKRDQTFEDCIKKCYYLEETWSDAIADHFYLTKKTRLQQQALWEFLTTERNYIMKLRVIVQVFQQCLKIIQSEGDLLEIQQSKLFSNINQVLLANDDLWTQQLRHIVNKTRQTKQPIKASTLLNPFREFDKLFNPYAEFSFDQDAALKYLRELTDDSKQTNKNFREYLAWCETLPQCGRFKLRDLLTEPMQRMTRYPLLLKKIRKESEDDEEKKELTGMITNAEGFITEINKRLRVRYEKERLMECLSQFEYYNSMEAANEEVKWVAVDFLQTDIQTLPVEEQRCLLKRGSMKLIEKKGKHEVIVELFLFTDVLVITKLKKSTNKLRVVKQLFYLDKVKLIKSEAASQNIVFVYLDEFGLLATAFLLESPILERDKWVYAIERAKTRYENAKRGQGSTLDFFCDDYTLTPSSFSIEHSSPVITNISYETTQASGNSLTTPIIKATRTVSPSPLDEPSLLTGEGQKEKSISWAENLNDVLETGSHNSTASWVLENKPGFLTNELHPEEEYLRKSAAKREGVTACRSDSGISVRTFGSLVDANNEEEDGYESLVAYQKSSPDCNNNSIKSLVCASILADDGGAGVKFNDRRATKKKLNSNATFYTNMERDVGARPSIRMKRSMDRCTQTEISFTCVAFPISDESKTFDNYLDNR